MFKLTAKFDADLLLYSFSHFELNEHIVHMPGHLLTHLLTHECLPCSRMHVPVHSHWLPGYTGVTETVLIILTKTEFFQCSYIYIYTYMRIHTYTHTHMAI